MKSIYVALLFSIASMFPQFAQSALAQQIVPTLEPTEVTSNQSFEIFLPFAGAMKSTESTNVSTQGFRYGIQAHILHEHEANRVLGAATDLGFSWVKQQVEWRLFEPAQGTIRYYMLDQMVRSANQSGTGLLFSVTHAPGWAREVGFDSAVDGPPAEPQRLASFLGQIAGKYCGSSLQAIEVWNEPNLGFEWGNREPNAAEYMVLLQASYTAIKAACPSMQVISAGLAPTGGNLPIAVDDQLYMAQLLDAGLTEYVDAVGAHPSGYNVPPSATWEQACDAIDQNLSATFRGPCESPHPSWSFRSTLEGYYALLTERQLERPIWVTEFGWAAGGALEAGYEYANDNDLSEQAEWSVEAFEMMEEWEWVTGAFLWNMNFRYIDSETEQAQWSIVTEGWAYQPAFAALQAMPKADAIDAQIVNTAGFEPQTILDGSPTGSSPVQIPEPVTVILFGSGLAGIMGYARKQNSKK